MRKTREILYLKWVEQRRHRHIARALGVGVGTVSEVVRRATARGLDWAAVEPIPEPKLEALLYGEASKKAVAPPPDPLSLHQELKRPGVTLALLYEEYLAQHPQGSYSYSQFCRIFARWRGRQNVVMHQEHRAGEKMFTDFSGKKPHWVDPITGEIHEVEVFVAVLGASNYTYVEATESQRVEHWIAAHVRAFEFFGGVAALTVPDQLKSGVTQACAYEPVIQRTYQECAHHYGTLIVPARPRRPRDKAKVEVAVQIAQRWILARLRNLRFFSLAELNEAIGHLLADLNARKMRRCGASRRELFERLDQPHLKPLPERRFECAVWKKAKVNINYHVEVEQHFYSVPYPLVHQQLEVRVCAGTVEVFNGTKRVAAHPRSLVRNGYTTKPEHMPRSHRAHAEWTPERMLTWAHKFGPHTTTLVERLLARPEHPEHAYNACLGILRLGKEYGPERLENAAVRAVALKAYSYRYVANVLKNNLDRLAQRAEPTESQQLSPLIASHENVRGEDYYR
jgi:transposase